MRRERDLEGADNRLRDLVLQPEYVAEVAIVSIGPDMGAGRAINELHIDADAAVAPPHVAFKHITHAEIEADLLHVTSTAAIDEAGVARNYKQPLDTR